MTQVSEFGPRKASRSQPAQSGGFPKTGSRQTKPYPYMNVLPAFQARAVETYMNCLPARQAPPTLAPTSR